MSEEKNFLKIIKEISIRNGYEPEKSFEQNGKLFIRLKPLETGEKDELLEQFEPEVDEAINESVEEEINNSTNFNLKDPIKTMSTAMGSISVGDVSSEVKEEYVLDDDEEEEEKEDIETRKRKGKWNPFKRLKD